MDEILTPTVHNFYEDDQMQMDTNMLEPPTRKPMYRYKTKYFSFCRIVYKFYYWIFLSLYHKIFDISQAFDYRSHLNAPPRDRTYMRDEVNEIETIVNTQILSASFSGRKRNMPLVEPLTYTLEHIQVSVATEST